MELDKRERWFSYDGEVFYGTIEELSQREHFSSSSPSKDEYECIALDNGWVHIYYDDSLICPLRIESFRIYSDSQIEYLRPIFEQFEDLIPLSMVADWEYMCGSHTA